MIEHPIVTKTKELNGYMIQHVSAAFRELSKYHWYGAAYSNFESMNYFSDFIQMYQMGGEL